MPITTTAADVPALLRPGMRVFVAGGANEPHGLIDALRARPERSAGVTFIQSIVPGLSRTDFTAIHPEARATTFFMTPQTQEAARAGKVDFIPMQLRVISDYLREVPVDLALMQFAATDDPAEYSAGLSADYVDSIVDTARCIVAEINEVMPAPAGAPRIEAARVAHVVPCNRALDPFPLTEPGSAARAIGKHVADLVRDGDCIQSGIGAIPYAVLTELGDKNDLGLHSGILDDAGQMLAEAGVVTGKAKALDRGLMVAANAIGTERFYRWAGAHPQVAFRPYSYTHHPANIAGLDNFVSINSAMQVDLFGQINSEMIEGRQLTGTGGSVDFIRGAALARGGRSIIAMTATAARGKLSRIIPALERGNAATALRTDIDYVVTEHGAAHLKYLPVHARARALIAIAAPQFRDHLSAEAEAMFGR